MINVERFALILAKRWKRNRQYTASASSLFGRGWGKGSATCKILMQFHGGYLHED